MFCPNCGKKVKKDTQKFCTYCGAKLFKPKKNDTSFLKEIFSTIVTKHKYFILEKEVKNCLEELGLYEKN